MPPPASSDYRSDPVRGAFWMIVSCALMAGVAVFARVLTTGGVHPFQVVFLRVVFAVVAMLPLLMSRGTAMLRTRQPRRYILRVLSAAVAMTTYFTALSLLPVGEVTAISFLTPLFTTLGAALILREVIEGRRWIALVVGFAGVLVILRPGFETLGAGAILAIVSAFAMGFSSVMIKRMTAQDDPEKIVFISTVLLVPLTFIPASLVWEALSVQEWLMLFAMGLIATLGHVTLARAYAATEASIVVGFDFSRLPFTVLFGWLALGELIDLWTWIGAGIIFLSSVAIVRRDAAPKLDEA